MVWTKPRGGQIAAMSAAASIVTTRQLDAGRLGMPSGGNGAQIVLGAVDERCEQQMGVQPSSSEPVVLSG